MTNFLLHCAQSFDTTFVSVLRVSLLIFIHTVYCADSILYSYILTQLTGTYKFESFDTTFVSLLSLHTYSINSLYMSAVPGADIVEQCVRGTRYEEFFTIVILKEQM